MHPIIHLKSFFCGGCCAIKRYFLPLTCLLFSGLTSSITHAQDGASVYTTRLDDARAIYLSGAVGDGKADDSAAIQAAIDKAYADRREGIVFIPEGRYRVSRTIYLPPSVRMIGWGAQRPVIILGDNTPGYDKGIAAVVMFTGARLDKVSPPPTEPVPLPPISPPGTVPKDLSIPDGNPSTFYSGLGNINIEIGEGNAGAVAIRYHGAQNDYLEHMDIHIGSGLAGVHQVGSIARNLRFFGGRYGIIAEKPTNAWQFTLLDSSFEGQRDAAIREHEVMLTLDNVTFRNTPIGIEIDPEYADWLWARNTRFENISHAAVLISAENNVYNQIAFENAVATNVPVFARFRESGKTFGNSGMYQVTELNHGLMITTPGKMGEIDTRYNAVPLTQMPAALPPVIRPLPPTSEWVSVKTFGAKGDNKTDDTAALRKAIAQHRVVYVPAGRYIVSDTLALKPDTVLIGLHPSITQFRLPDFVPAYQGVGKPKPLLSTPQGGDNIVSGLGLAPGGTNPRSAALFWQAGENSLAYDIYFPGGAGTANPDGTEWNPYNANLTGDPDINQRWDGRYPSLWVTNGGGGTFANIWTPAAYAQSGMLISDTKTPGRIYQISSEHHVRSEFQLRNVENWDFYAPQTEEQSTEGLETVAMEIVNSRNITLANFHAYRVTKTLKPVDTAVRIFNSSDIRFRNMHVNAESGFPFCDVEGCSTFLRASKFPFDNALRDMTNGIEVRERQFAFLDYLPSSSNAKKIKPVKPATMGNEVKKLAGDFWSISGAAVDANGKLYFVDQHQQRIYTWSDDEGLNIERDNPHDPVNLAFDDSGNLLVLSKDSLDGTVYSFKPGSSPANDLTVIKPTPVKPRPEATVLLAGNYWLNGEFKDQLNPETYVYTTHNEMFVKHMQTPRPNQYVSVDGSLILPAVRVIRQRGPLYFGWRFSDNLQTYGFIRAKPGQRTYIVNSSEARTYSGLVNADGTVTDLKIFTERGGESVAVDSKGNVFLANGQVLAYDKNGKKIGQIDVPERPIQIIFGGKDKRTLFILTHRSLYSVKMRTAG
jgi:Pectate lyase superfamily protein/SMP-30/Gluconolactonase/LRE-like region